MKNIKTVNINFRPSSSVRPNLTSTRAGENRVSGSRRTQEEETDGEDPGDEGGGEDVGGGSGGGSGEAPDPAA